MAAKIKEFPNKNSALRRRTRYVQGGTSEMSGKNLKFWERDLTLLEEAPDDEFIQSLPSVYSGRPGLLAYDLYDDEGLEWIILQCNNIVDLEEEFVTGVSLRVPSRRRVNTAILVKTVNFVNVSSE